MSDDLSLANPPTRRRKQRKAKQPFEELLCTPQQHFKLYLYAAVLHIMEQVAQSFHSREQALSQFPFLVGYHNELADCGLVGIAFDEAEVWWQDALYRWEEASVGHLPLRALREQLGLDHGSLTMLLAIGLVEEDARFGKLYEAMQGTPGQHRPIVGLLSGWWREAGGDGTARINIQRLQELGLIKTINPEAPRPEWALQVPGPMWETLRGETRFTLAPGLYYRTPQELSRIEDLIVSESVRTTLQAIPPLLKAGEAQALIVRGPQHNGRRTFLGAVARSLDQGTIEIENLHLPNDERWDLIGPLATLLNALPILILDLTPGETAEIPQPRDYAGVIGVVLGKHGGVNGTGVERALTLTLEMPDPEARCQLWRRGLNSHGSPNLDFISEHFRMSSGNIHRIAQLAQSYAALDSRAAITVADVQQANRAMNRQTLDTLAVWLTATGDWTDLAVSPETQHELQSLESRCRFREHLRGAVGAALGSQLNSGVRALFSGPSGTGKSLAARLLASILQKDLYRLDLSSVVNKYIGETEKNLNQIFARAEELDVILLLDEGDALLTQRTNVHTSNDRYANLETNFLLQRLESFEGILIVTTNTIERIDRAFQRRMDVLVDFHPPDESQRWAIWQLHLPSSHAIEMRALQEIVRRCVLTGGQIRNAVLHASLLALNDGTVINSVHVQNAIQREYRKMGALCPLRANLV